MMSAAILIPTGTSQTNAHPPSADRTQPEGASFAESLDERVGYPALLQGKNSPAVTSVTLRSPKNTEASQSGEVTVVSARVGKATIAGQMTPENGKLKNNAPEIAQPQMVTVTGSQGKTVGGCVLREI